MIKAYESKRLIVALFSAAVIVLAVVLFLQRSNNNDDPDRRLSADNAEIRKSEHTGAGNAGNRSIDADDAGYEQFANARSAMVALEKISALDSRRKHDIVEARMYVAGICIPYAQGKYIRGTNAWLDTRIETYCKHYHDPELIAATPEQSEQIMLRGTRSYIEKIIDDASKNGRNAGITAMEDVAMMSDSPLEVHAALQIASERAYVPEAVRRSLRDSDLNHARDILALTAELQYCAMTQGCGRNSAAAIRGCLATSICGDNLSYMDQLRQIYPPAIFESAIRAQRALNAHRHKSG